MIIWKKRMKLCNKLSLKNKLKLKISNNKWLKSKFSLKKCKLLLKMMHAKFKNWESKCLTWMKLLTLIVKSMGIWRLSKTELCKISWKNVLCGLIHKLDNWKWVILHKKLRLHTHIMSVKLSKIFNFKAPVENKWTRSKKSLLA